MTRLLVTLALALVTTAARAAVSEIPGGDSVLVGTVVSTGTPVAGAVPTYSGTTGTNLAPSSVTISGGTNLAAGTITATNQFGFTGFTVANLPTGVGVGYQTYCTDCLTPWGTGDRVEWDGIAWWTTCVRIPPTASLPAYVLSCVAEGIHGLSTQLSDIDSAKLWGSTQNGILGRAFYGAGTAATLTLGTTTNGTQLAYNTGSTALGSYRSLGVFVDPASTAALHACGGSYAVSVLPSAAETFIAVVGMNATYTTNLPINGVFFLADPYNLTAHGQAYTNNWICVTSASSSYTYSNSGLAILASATVSDRLAIELTSTSATFFTNGVACSTNSATLPTGNLYLNYTHILKAVGTTSRTLYEVAPWYHSRRLGNRTF